MKFPIPVNLTALAQECAFPLYLVGGSVRDFFAGFSGKEITDWDICAPVPEEELTAAAERCGFTVKSVFRNTGTVKLCDRAGIGYEFTRFRSDKYVRGLHVPAEIEFTDDLRTDARRRDFCVNAMYYEIRTGELIDPLGGLDDLKNKILRTVAPAEKVFGEDGLRLMRLARFTAETGFLPDEECSAGAQKHRALIRDIAPERVFAELSAILHADEKHGDKEAPYRGLCVLRDTGVLGEILPELARGDGLAQRPEYHAYDVLEHSLRCVKYAPPEIRFAALLHDVGKPFCYFREGNFHGHETEGARIAKQILTRLKAPAKLVDETRKLVLMHMRDFNLQMRESKIRRTIVSCYSFLPKLLALKQADFSACKDDLSPAPSVERWKNVLAKMQAEGVPFSLGQLAVNGSDLKELGVPPKQIGKTLKILMSECTLNGTLNQRAKLKKRVSRMKFTEEP